MAADVVLQQLPELSQSDSSYVDSVFRPSSNVPRDRQGTFEQQLVRKHQTRWDGLDDKIIALHARGMAVRDIQAQLHEMYGVEVSPGLISEVTDAVLDEVKTWQNRPLDSMYPVVYLDALMVKMRHEGRVENRAVYVRSGSMTRG